MRNKKFTLKNSKWTHLRALWYRKHEHKIHQQQKDREKKGGSRNSTRATQIIYGCMAVKGHWYEIFFHLMLKMKMYETCDKHAVKKCQGIYRHSILWNVKKTSATAAAAIAVCVRIQNDKTFVWPTDCYLGQWMEEIFSFEFAPMFRKIGGPKSNISTLFPVQKKKSNHFSPTFNLIRAGHRSLVNWCKT